MTYGVQPTGYVRKPLSVILAEIEAAMITEFGPGVIQTPQSPLGQLNGLMADLIAELWEVAEDVYQSYDPDQAEGVRLDILGRLRLLSRGAEADGDFRRSITNAGRARVDIQDIARAVAGVAGVTYSRVFVNDSRELDENGIPPNSIAVAVIGGDDDDIGAIIRQYVMPGIGTYGNHSIETAVDGFCRTFRIVRPINVPVSLTLRVRLAHDKMGCPPPALVAIANSLYEAWEANKINGGDVTFYSIRSLVESRFQNVEVVSITASRDGGAAELQASIGFVEIATLDNITVEEVA